ncbi:MAG TPA: hypothetical protein PKV86_03235, partial [Syntrophobacteraceae bacterium]|nr:hypothetical protein [Syntrophobacteraceae bacterium]
MKVTGIHSGGFPVAIPYFLIQFLSIHRDMARTADAKLDFVLFNCSDKNFNVFADIDGFSNSSSQNQHITPPDRQLLRIAPSALSPNVA